MRLMRKFWQLAISKLGASCDAESDSGRPIKSASALYGSLSLRTIFSALTASSKNSWPPESNHTKGCSSCCHHPTLPSTPGISSPLSAFVQTYTSLPWVFWIIRAYTSNPPHTNDLTTPSRFGAFLIGVVVSAT